MQSTYEIALDAATRFLRRCRDGFTRPRVEELAQEAATQTWQRAAEVRCADLVPSYARTVAKRLRARARIGGRFDQLDVGLAEDPTDAYAQDTLYVEGCEWDKGAVLAVLEQSFDRVGRLNACLIRGFYDGFSCRELGERFGLDDQAVKARLHRTRRRLRAFVMQRLSQARSESELLGQSPDSSRSNGEV